MAPLWSVCRPPLSLRSLSPDFTFSAPGKDVGQKDPRIPHSRSNPPCRSLLMLVTTDHGCFVGSRQRAADFFIACLHVCILVAYFTTRRPSCCRMTMAKAGGTESVLS
ncbi:hypothetical protein BR93DRAFT_930791 [Coniochaeta sp. PMI_546]|nr:hypothetical protein BR93DRAFT_930791 [Coniochaeta sp. PMI_546]